MSFSTKGSDDKPDKESKPNFDKPKESSKIDISASERQQGYKPPDIRDNFERIKHPKKETFIADENQNFNPTHKSKNKIEPQSFPVNFKPKNKIEGTKLQANSAPKSKIEKSKPPVNSNPKNIIEKPILPPIHKPKNRIELHNIPTTHTPKNSINQPSFPQNFIQKNVPKEPNDNGTKKECGRCHEIKSLNDFEMNSKKKTYESYCRPCRLEYKQIRALQNKNNIIRNIHGGKYAEKCPKCNTSTSKLPAFDFHHPIKDLKTKRINFHGNWENVLKKLEKEKAIPICRNCHLKEQSKYYKKYKELIEKKNDFESSVKGIEKKLYKVIYNRFPEKGHKEGYQIKSWISKRIVVDRLYNGKCISCGEKNIATLQFHHRDKNKKTFEKYDKLRYTTIEKIEKKLIKDDAVCICGNCHRMTEAYNFKKNHQEIIGNKHDRELTIFYDNLKEAIKSFKFPENILEQYPHIKTEKIEIGGWKPKSYVLTPDEEGIKKEISSIKWNEISQNWKLPTGELLNPLKESSSNNPLYKHKKWLEYVYYELDLSDNKIARITNTSQTTINYWRKKLKIYSKIHIR